MGFTDHDRDLAFESIAYRAATGFSATAIADQVGLAVSNLDVEDAPSSAAIAEADLHAGRYDDAVVTIFLANRADTSKRVIPRSDEGSSLRGLGPDGGFACLPPRFVAVEGQLGAGVSCTKERHGP